MSKSTKVYEILAFTFEGEDKAKAELKRIKKERKAEGVKILNAATLTRSAEGKIKVKETKDMGGGVGAVLGGGLMLVLTGGLGAVLLGALGGGAIAKWRDSGFNNDELQEFADSMPNDSSAILVLLEDKDEEKLMKDMEGMSKNVVTLTLSDEKSGMVESYIAGDIEVDTESDED